MWTVYLLRCSDRSLYCGISNDVKSRLRAHQAGKGAKYTRGRLPLKLVYTEEVSSKSAALKRELRIKKLSKKEKEFMVKNSPTDIGRCPKCGGTDIIMFDSDNDICEECNEWFPGT